MTIDELLLRLSPHLVPQDFVGLSCSAPRTENSPKLLRCKPLLLKGSYAIQVESFKGKQAFQKNYSPSDFLAWLGLAISEFRQHDFSFSTESWKILVGKTGALHLSQAAPSRPSEKSTTNLSHNRTKHYILPDGVPVHFLVELGVMSPEGRVRKEHQDKFRQINRFLEYIADIVPYLRKEGTLQVLDFGCGKAYLSFALYYYLTEILKREVNVLGLDLKEDVVTFCNSIAQKLDFKDLTFKTGDIAEYQTASSHREAPREPTDLLVTLHACDTATDLALAEGIARRTTVILSVPCCQHELFHQMTAPSLGPLIRHGLIKERFAALATDAIRASLAELCGYDVSLVEFIDPEHTPKNLMLRLIRRKTTSMPYNSSQKQDYEAFRTMLGANPAMEQALLDRGVIPGEQLAL